MIEVLFNALFKTIASIMVIGATAAAIVGLVTVWPLIFGDGLISFGICAAVVIGIALFPIHFIHSKDEHDFKI